MKKCLFIWIVFLQTSILFAADGKYAVNKISPLLLINANAVLRMEHETFEIYGADEAKYTKQYAITILNENADFWANFVESYDKLIKISDVDGILFDAFGNEVKRLKNKEVNDYSASGSSLADDNRVKQHNFSYKIYPYTIEYTVVIKYKNNTMFFPPWMPQKATMFSVENSDITVIAPKAYQVRYKATNAAIPIQTFDGSKQILTWQANNLMAIKGEQYAPRWNELVTSVKFGPSNFEVQNYKGNLQSWKDFGLFSSALKQGRDELPPNVKKEVHDITNGINTAFGKVDALYKYLQKNTRYISIQLGIGGWQPFDATYVATKGYGDCKALSNYMYSLLKEAGIKSIYTIVKAGNDAPDIAVDFPSAQFNHIIVCVPNNNDTIWLECTSQSLPTGYLSGFTANRHVLLVDGEESKICTTPTYTAQQNKKITKIVATLHADASLTVDAKTQYHCLKQDDVQMMINHYSNEKIKEKLSQNLHFATYDVNHFSYKENKLKYPFIDENLQLTVSNYAAITGKRMFIVPNVMTRMDKYFSVDQTRKFDIVFDEAFTETDTVEINIPAGYMLELAPKQTIETSAYATYKSSTTVVENKIIFIRSFVQLSGRFAAADYTSIATFYDKLYKADNSKMVFVKKE